MTATKFTGPVGTYTVLANGNAGGYSDLGWVQMAQVQTIAANGTNVVNASFALPQGSQIIGFNIDVVTAFDSVTSATLTVGQTSGATQYASGVNAKTTGRAAPTYTTAQLTAMSNIGTTPAVVATVTPVGATTVGSVIVTVLYMQLPQAGDTP